MGERFSAVMDGRLVEIFVDKLRDTLAEAGFVETLRLPTPHVSEFQRDSDVVVVQTEHAHEPRKQRLVVESESVDVSLMVDSAARLVVGDILDQILSSLQKIDRIGTGSTGQSTSSLQRLKLELREWSQRTG